MAASGSTVGGYSCELFISPVPEELKCGLCKKVARDPNLVSCCGEQFCRGCTAEGKQPCPLCGKEQFTLFTNKRDQKRIISLMVRCAMKDRGCEWTGTLEHINAHLDASSDNCQYVDVECPNKCDRPVQKCHLVTHLTDSCTKRDFMCQYCNFKGKYEVVCNEHWPECQIYPVPCPNGCEILAIERGDLDAHMILCSMVVVECDFSYAGCNVKLVREEMEKHLADNLQRHMLMMNKALQEKIEQKERKIEQLEAKLEQRDRQIQELRDKHIQDLRLEMEERDRQREEQLQVKSKQIQETEAKVAAIEKRLTETEQLNQDLHLKLEQSLQRQDRQILETDAEVALIKKQLEGKVRQIEENERRLGVRFAMPGFKAIKANKSSSWYSPPLYTHPGGYMICVCVWLNGRSDGRGTHVTVWLCRMVSEIDDQLKWPADCTITLQLLNQHRDQDHVTVSRRSQWDKVTEAGRWGIGTLHAKFVAHTDLEWNAAKQTQYLKNDCLQFRISEIQVHSI